MELGLDAIPELALHGLAGDGGHAMLQLVLLVQVEVGAHATLEPAVLALQELGAHATLELVPHANPELELVEAGRAAIPELVPVQVGLVEAEQVAIPELQGLVEVALPAMQEVVLLKLGRDAILGPVPLGAQELPPMLFAVLVISNAPEGGCEQASNEMRTTQLLVQTLCSKTRRRSGPCGHESGRHLHARLPWASDTCHGFLHLTHCHHQHQSCMDVLNTD